jgi:hypothetical protein
MTEMTLRLARLRQIANTTTTPDYGRGHIAYLLEQECDALDVTCPRYAGIAENCGDRTIVVADNPAALVEELCELALAEVSHQPEAIIDLDTEVRHEADRTMTLRFRPELPGLREQRSGEGDALKIGGIELTDAEGWLVRNALAAYREDAKRFAADDDDTEFTRTTWLETITRIDALEEKIG